VNDQRLLLTLLIHRSTREKYYHDHDTYVEKQKKWLESINKQPFGTLPLDTQTKITDTWFWPPWRFNDLVGFAEIELENDWTVVGHLYLPEGRVRKGTKKPLLLNFVCASANFKQDDLNGLQEAIIEVAEQLQSIVAKRKWKLEFGRDLVEHTDFLAMISARKMNNVE
jgi:hypothetical protein